MSWIDSSFDFLKNSIVEEKAHEQKSSQSRGQKRPLKSKSNDSITKVKVSSELWCDKYEPKEQTGLAVHKKKVEEVIFNVERVLTSKVHIPPVILLTGPCGAGKTASIRVIAKQLKLDLQEWISPSQDNISMDSNDEFSLFRSVSSKSQSQLFQDFLLRATKYASLNGSNRKLILVEDFPNVFLRDSCAFKDIVRNYCLRGKSPLVFVVSDSQSSESIERLLFPKDFQSEVNMNVISFNPITNSNIVKALQKMLAAEKKGSSLSKDEISAIAERSNGDIRTAINSLQFMCLKSKPSKLLSTISKPKKSRVKNPGANTKREKVEIGDKDSSLYLFRALGKVLYCKRDERASQAAGLSLPPPISQYDRPALIENPEEIVHRCHLSPELFIAFLHQNYLSFLEDSDDLTMAAEFLSDADFLTFDWTCRGTMQDYASSVACRGLMFSNGAHSGLKATPGWKPLHKPELFSVTRKGKSNALAACQLFRLQTQEPRELLTQTLPFTGLMSKPLASQQQRFLVKDLVCFYSNSHIRRNLKKLDEKELSSENAVLTVTDVEHPLPIPMISAQDDVECVIEDFDD